MTELLLLLAASMREGAADPSGCSLFIALVRVGLLLATLVALPRELLGKLELGDEHTPLVLQERP